MDDKDFEGTMVLEMLAAVGGLEAFSDAVDADDRRKAIKLMRSAHIDAETVAMVLRRMAAGDDEPEDEED